MAFARDKLYKGYLLKKMPTIVSTVKVREFVVHLSCLTDHDRENIEAKREVCGNYDSMVLLLDCLKRRENWPEQFIAALEACDHQTLAAEIRAEYNALRGINNSNPSSTPVTVTQAHVHPAPSASHLPIPERGGNGQDAVSLPAEASAPPPAQASPPMKNPVQPQPCAAPESSVNQAPEAVSPPEPPQSTPVEVAPAHSTPPPSPVTAHAQGKTTPPPQKEINSHQEPVENSESDIQDISGDNGVIPDEVTAGNGEVSIHSMSTLQPSDTVEQSEMDTPFQPDPRQTTTTEVSPPRSPSPTKVNLDVTDGSSVHMKTPDKSPVQDTTPPVELEPATVEQPEETYGPPATQVVVSTLQTQTAATTAPLLGAVGMDASVFDESTLCLSRPGQLISIQPQMHGSPTILAPTEPYSGNSDRLEMSTAAPDAVTSGHVPACSADSSTTVNTNSALPCQQNGFALNHNEPEENQYESPCQSLEEVRVNLIQISEEASVLNLDGQSATPQAQIVNGETAKEMTSAPPQSTNTADTVSSVNTSSRESCHPSEPAPSDVSPELETLQEPEEKTNRLTNTKYILTATGVAACALLMAWKFKN